MTEKWLRLNAQHKANITKKLLDADLDLPASGCPFCDSSSSKSTVVVELQSEPAIHRLTCAACHCTYVDRMPSDAYLAHYYRGYYDGDSHRTHINTKRLSRRICQFAGSQSKEQVRILDFGGGDGGVAIELMTATGSQSSFIAVVDFNRTPHPSPPRGAVIEHFSTLEETTDLPPFDFVIASAVLEHVKPLRGILATLLQRLAPGGLFYARTPYTVPLHRTMSRFRVNFDTNFPAHIFDLGPRFWDTVIETLALADSHKLLASRPSLVETEWSTHPFITGIATAMKLPWFVLGNIYPWVGGWEVLIRRLPK